MTAADDDRSDNDRIEDKVDSPKLDESADDGEEDEFATNDEEVASDELDEIVDDTLLNEEDEEGEEPDIDAVVELSEKEMDARSMEIRRELEKRREQRELHEDIDYLDLDD